MRKLLVAVLLAVVAPGAQALDRIISVPGQYSVCNSCTWSPMGVTFDAGTYTVTPVLANSAPGAFYTAYNFGAGLGWSAAYGIGLDPGHISDFGLSGPHAGTGWPDELAAFAHSAIGSFSIDATQTVYFGVPDSYHSDNFGGVSLRVSPVPLPGGIALLLPGMALLATAHRRRPGRDQVGARHLQSTSRTTRKRRVTRGGGGGKPAPVPLPINES